MEETDEERGRAYMLGAAMIVMTSFGPTLVYMSDNQVVAVPLRQEITSFPAPEVSAEEAAMKLGFGNPNDVWSLIHKSLGEDDTLDREQPRPEEEKSPEERSLWEVINGE